MGDKSPKDAEKRKKKKAAQQSAKATQAAPARPDIIVKASKQDR